MARRPPPQYPSIPSQAGDPYSDKREFYKSDLSRTFGSQAELGEMLPIVEEVRSQKVSLADQLYGGIAALLTPPKTVHKPWLEIAHDFQIPPDGVWSIWLMMAGRGSGKTRAAAELVTDRVMSGQSRVIGLIAPTAADVRDVMVNGPGGLVAVAEMRGIECVYQPSYRRVVWPAYGAHATMFSAEEPRRLRGPNHDFVWAEEVAAWQDAWKGDVEETTWNNAMLGLRLGDHAPAVVTSTPKPVKLMKQIVERAKVDPEDVRITTGSTYANRANLSKNFFKNTVSRYEGTRLGRQELMGELLEDVEGALWQHEWIDATRIIRGDWYPWWRGTYDRVPQRMVTKKLPSNLLLPTPDMIEIPEPLPYDVPLPEMPRVVLAIDPNTSDDPNADEAGIVVAALGADGRGYLLDDRSELAGPTEWAKTAVYAYHEWLVDKAIAERNNGGEMVAITLHQVDPNVNVELVWASRGKTTRAEPVAALYEQGRISHVGEFPELEDELCSWVSGSPTSPGRLDAVVWAFTNLFNLTLKGTENRSRKLMVFQ